MSHYEAEVESLREALRDVEAERAMLRQKVARLTAVIRVFINVRRRHGEA